MRVLILSPYPNEISSVIVTAGDSYTSSELPLTDQQDADFVVSYGYRHIVREPHLSKFAGRIINLHISFLPWNRGSDPNFWSWFDGTPKGVSIHAIDEKLDTGPLLVSNIVAFNANETLATSYAKLRTGMANLFAQAWPEIRKGTIEGEPASGRGSYHRVKDKVPYWQQLPQGHETPVQDVEKLGAKAARSAATSVTLNNSAIVEQLAIIDEIEKVRATNNVNWMDLLRLSFKVAPKEAKDLVRRINTDDNRISELLARLGK
jgi:hypothetical protein